MQREPRGKFDPAKMSSGGRVELPAEKHEEAVRQIAIADDECRVNFRWGSSQLEIVKRVADLMGVSYQQYIKQVLYRQAKADLNQFSEGNKMEAPQ
ncbi:hypothetical protein BH11CYA1_BH11CYA1_27930 [soil metagenome]